MSRKQIGVKFPEELVAKLDGWLEDLNKSRRIALNRSELIVGVLDWAADTRPAWEGRPYPAEPPPPLRAAEPTGPAYGLAPGDRGIELDGEAAAAQEPPAKPRRSRR